MILLNEPAPTDEAPADADLVLRTRSGDTQAFGELWRRHYPSGIAVARSITSSIDADDLVQESYTRIYQAIAKGGGPTGSFRSYLFTSIRNTAAGWGRSRREYADDELETVADPDSTESATNEALDRGLTAKAFRSLPTRWQEVLWYTEIEQMKPREIGPLLGMKAGAVSQLAFRAREGLREAWIQAHLRSATPGSPCEWTIENLGTYSRGNMSARDQQRLEDHLEECTRCTIVAAEAKDVSMRLSLVLLPLVLGVTGAAGYLATLQGVGAPVVALAAMPSAVVQGAVVLGGSAPAAAGIAASAVGASVGGAAGGTTAGSGVAGGGAAMASASAAAGSATAAGATAMTSVGVLVGVGATVFVVAGVVVAATVLPGAFDTPPVAATSSASTDTATERPTLTEPVVIEVEETSAPVEAVTPPAPVEPVPSPPPASDTKPPVVAPPVVAPPVAPPVVAPPVVAPPVVDPPVVDPPVVDPPVDPPVVPPAITPLSWSNPTSCDLVDDTAYVTLPIAGTPETSVSAHTRGQTIGRTVIDANGTAALYLVFMASSGSLADRVTFMEARGESFHVSSGPTLSDLLNSSACK